MTTRARDGPGPGSPAAAERPAGASVVTGASQGIGRDVALGIARYRPGPIVLVARRRDRLEQVAREIDRLGTGATGCVHPADLALQGDVRRLSAEILREHPRISILVNNAGAWFHRRAETAEGVERTVALNLLAPVRLTESLRPALRAGAPSRVVMVASEAHRGYRLDLSDPEGRRGYRGFTAYGRSKLALIAMTRLLSDRYREDRIDVNAVHPGFVASGFGQNNGGAVGFGMRVLEALAGRSNASGARGPIRLATDPALEGTTGEYFKRERPAAPSRAADDPAETAALWSWCESRAGSVPRGDPGASGGPP